MRITVACERNNPDEAISKIYRFTSVLSWYLGGYVDVSGYLWGTHPCLYGDPRTVYSSLGIFGKKSFSCNNMPVIESDSARKALAFWREGQRLRGVHASYAFLSFYKVVESQFSDSNKKVAWINQAIERLSGDATRRVAELKAAGKDVGPHLFRSGRCAVAHASLEGEIVDPDIPGDRKRLQDDLVIVEDLARMYIRDELGIPDSRSLYRSRNRLLPWFTLFTEESLDLLERGGAPTECGHLNGQRVDVGLWPDGPIRGLEDMVLHVDTVKDGVVKIVLINDRKTALLIFYLDFRTGKVHTNLEEGGLHWGAESPDERDVLAYATFFYNVLGNRVAELICSGREPVDCEVVIPVNIVPPNPEEAIHQALEKYRAEASANG